jgi:hypothetical protein
MYEGDFIVATEACSLYGPDLGEIGDRQPRRSTKSSRPPWFGDISKYLEIEVFRAR